MPILHRAQPLLKPPRRGRRKINLERPPAGQHLVQHAAKSVDVGPFIQALAAPLLRGHISRGAGNPLPTHNALPATCLYPGWAHVQVGLPNNLSQAIVRDLGQSSLGNEDVFRLQVAVNQARLFLLGVDQAPADINSEVQGQLHVEGTAPQPTPQVGSLAFFPSDPFQDHKGLVVEDVHVEAAHDVGMLLQRHPGRHFLLKGPAQPLGIGLVALLEGFEGVGLDGFQVEAQVHFAHAAHEGLMDLVATADSITALVVGLRSHH